MRINIYERGYKEALFVDGKIVTPWFDAIFPEGIYQGESNYFIASFNGSQAIFEFFPESKKVKRITPWFDKIEPKGLVKGQSEFFIARIPVKDNNQDIFHIPSSVAIFRYKDKEGKVERITPLFGEIYIEAFPEGKLRFFKALIPKKGWALFEYRDGKVVRLTDFVSYIGHIRSTGLEEGKTTFVVISKSNEKKEALFEYQDGDLIQVSDWYKEIYPVSDKNTIFIVKSNEGIADIAYVLHLELGKLMTIVHLDPISFKSKISRIRNYEPKKKPNLAFVSGECDD